MTRLRAYLTSRRYPVWYVLLAAIIGGVGSSLTTDYAVLPRAATPVVTVRPTATPRPTPRPTITPTPRPTLNYGNLNALGQWLQVHPKGCRVVLGTFAPAIIQNARLVHDGAIMRLMKRVNAACQAGRMDDVSAAADILEHW